MISFQRLLGREEQFCDLLEASAQEGCHSVDALRRMVNAKEGTRSLDEFVVARRKDKEITEKITEMLVMTFVTPMEREDIEALAEALYKIPKTAEKFAERFLIVADKIQDFDFNRQLELLEQAVNLVHRMVQAIGQGRDLGGIKVLQAKLQEVESQGDMLVLAITRRFYEPGFPALKAVMVKDLIELIEKAIDRCRDAGNVISHVLLKNS